MRWKNLCQRMETKAIERGSEITEQIFWIGLIILAVLLLLPQLRGVLLTNLQSLIDALGV